MGDQENGVTTTDVFPEAGLPTDQLYDRLDVALAEVPAWDSGTQTRLGFAMSAPHPVAVEAYSRFLPLNTNNVGIHTGFGAGQSGTRRLEREALLLLGGLLNADAVDGYITSGGSEAAIQALRIGRNSVLSGDQGPVTLITSEFAHHSIPKAAELLAVRLHVVPASLTWTMERHQLRKAISEVMESGSTRIILALTAGYFNSGLCDPIDELTEQLREIAIAEPTLKAFCYVDASHGGLVYPFTDPSLAFDFRNAGVHAIAVDPHKMGFMPYACGALLLRKNLLRQVSTVSPSTGIVDSTLLGSRPGAAAAGLWAVIHKLGRSGFKAAMADLMQRRDQLMAVIREADKDAELRPAPAAPVVSVAFTTPNGRLPDDLVKDYRLVKIMAPSRSGARRPYYHFYAGHSLSQEQIYHFGVRLRQAVTACRQQASTGHFSRVSREPPSEWQPEKIEVVTDCLRHFVVHPPGRRDVEGPDYSFHTFLQRSMLHEQIQVRTLGPDSFGSTVRIFAPDLAKPFENEFFGIEGDGYTLEILDELQQKLSLVGATHFSIPQGSSGYQLLMNLESNGQFRSLEYKFKHQDGYDEVQCFLDRVVIKIGKDARAVRRSPSEDAYSFSIDTSFECTVTYLPGDRPATVEWSRYHSDPLLPRQAHQLRQEYSRFPNRFYDVELGLAAGADASWSVSQLLGRRASGWCLARTSSVGCARVQIGGARNTLDVVLTELLGSRQFCLQIDPTIGGRIGEAIPVFDVSRPATLNVDEVRSFGTRAHSILASSALPQPILHDSEGSSGALSGWRI